jgi:hypothetical protein
MRLIDNPLKTVTVWMLGAATLVIALEALVPQLKGLLPEQWYAWLIPAALVARLVKQHFGEKPPAKERIRVEERGWVPFYLLPWIALFAFVSLLLIACAPRLTETEVRCLASVEVRESLELASCGKDTSGACSTDAVMDKYDPQAEACVTGGAK